jgi:hypothetical protein
VADRPGNHRITLGADKAYDVAEFVADLREFNVTPHVAQNTTNRRSAIDGRTTHHPGYAVSGRVRKRIEEVFGWAKAAAGFRKTHHRGLAHRPRREWYRLFVSRKAPVAAVEYQPTKSP